ncbi:MAG: hypothetical protein IPM54_45190 [Polyangiaceae bacterium]|nr:hypothetical protein [Polyangiaceae bacterium]
MSQSAENTQDPSSDNPSEQGATAPEAAPLQVAPDVSQPEMAVADASMSAMAPEPPMAASPTIPLAPLHVVSAEAGPLPAAPPPPLPQAPSKWRSFIGRIGSSARNALLLLALGVAIFVFLIQVNQHYAIKNWLFWTYAKIWGWCSLFALASASSGHLVVKAIGGKTLPFVERTIMSFACGVIFFYFVMFGGGLLGIYGHVFAVVMPIVVFGLGAVPLLRHVRRSVRHFRAARARVKGQPSPWLYPILLFGAAGVAMIYFAILSAKNIAYDAYFYHLGLAQQYAVEGAIRAFPEAWLPAAIPHLASVLYTWTFILPGMNMFERVVCAAHLEFVIFLMTLVSVTVLVRKLVPKAKAGLSWAAFFLFPGLLVYDSALSAAADHINAFWAIPIFLMMLRSLRSLDVDKSGGAFAARNFGLLATFLAAAMLTKYQAMYLAAFPLMAIAFAVVWFFGRALVRRRDLLRPTFRAIFAGLGTALVVGLLVTTPHWLKNWFFYGDPLFPYLSRFMLSPKWVPDTSALFAGWDGTQHQNWRPKGTLPEKLAETAQAVVMFSFQPHDWAKFHGKVPIFGSLFTLSALILPFLKKTKRIWALFVATHVGVVVWYWTLHQDRYLQALLPWMVCTVAATLLLLWRQAHWSAKPLACMLVGVQIVWGGDAYFIPAHAMTGNSAAPVTAELLAQGMKGKHKERYGFGDRLFEMGRDPALPQDARVLLHEHETRLGLWRTVVSDQPGLAYAYRYEMLKGPAEVYERIRGLGVTHIIARVEKSTHHDSLGADIQFFAFMEREPKLIKKFGEWALYSMPTAPSKRTPNNIVAYLGCGAQYERGLHKLSSLSVRERQVVKRPPRVKATQPMPTQPQEFPAFIAQADYIVTDSKCKPPAPLEATQGFVQIATRDPEQLWMRAR